MYVAGVEQFVVHLLNAWVVRGGRAEADLSMDGQSWLLTLNGPEKFRTWISCLLVCGMLAGLLIMQSAAPAPPWPIWFSAVLLGIIVVVFFCCCAHIWWYRVELTKDELVLRQ